MSVNRRISIFPHLILGAGFALLMLSAVAGAVERNEHLNVPELDRPEYLPTQPGGDFQLPPLPPLIPLPAPVAADAPGDFWVEKVVFRGNTVVSTDTLDAIAASYRGRRVNAAELETLRQRLTRHYVDLGYVNSGVLLSDFRTDFDAPRNAAPHAYAIVFVVVEGRLNTLRLRGMDGLNDDYIVRRLRKEADGPLNIDLLRERYQLLLSDPLFQRLNARLMPDTRLGEAVLDLEIVRAKPYQVTLFADNYRPPSIGSEALGVSGWLRNSTGQGDFLEASIQSPRDSVADSRLSLAWQMPLGQLGTYFSASIDHGRSSVIEEPMQILNIRSILDSQDFGISQSLFETLRHKLTFGVNHIRRENRTTLLGSPFSFNPGEPDGIGKEVLWRFWQEYTYRSETQVLALRSTFSFGKNNLRNTGELLPDAAPTIPQTHYRIWLGQARYARQVLENGAQVVVRGSLQRTQEKLLALDGMSIGGIDTVRGYRENQLIRDNGETFSLEWDYPLFAQSAEALNVSLIPFYDYGRGQNRNEAAAKLSSWGLASRVRWQGVNFDLALARQRTAPVSNPSNRRTLQDRGMHFRLSYNF